MYCVALSSNGFNTVNGNSGVLVRGLRRTFFKTSPIIESKSVSVKTVLCSLAYRLKTSLTSLIRDSVGL